MIILLTARYSKYINVDANSGHQRFCECVFQTHSEILVYQTLVSAKLSANKQQQP